MERIDVHVHCVPPQYREYCLKSEFAGNGHPDGMPAIPKWDPFTHIELMKRLNIKKSVLSISSPGTHLSPGNDQEARALTRQVNTDIAEVCSEHQEHFLFFASLPLPDVEGSLSEIDYALDHLGTVDFQILTNSHGIYPGDPKFRRVFDKLNERQATLFIHPTSCNVRHEDGSTQQVNPQPEFPRPLTEFMFDSTRSLMSILTSGMLTRCPDITLLVCHCGATFPPVMQRIAEFSGPLLGKDREITAEDVKSTLQTRVYFDLAGVPFPDQVHGLLRLVDSTRLLYGSDYPYTPAPVVKDLMSKMDGGLARDFESDMRAQVLMKNAEEFLGLSMRTD